MENIIVVGSSGHAGSVIDAIEKASVSSGKYRVVGLIDDYRQPGEKTFEYRVLGKIDDLPRLIVEYSTYCIVIAIGDNFSRYKVVEKVKSLCPKAYFPVIVHPRAIIGRDISFGEGTYVGAGAVISPRVSIGKFCILNPACLCGHNAVMEDFSALFSSKFGAYSRLGFCAALGIGSTVIPNITIGDHTVIGAGSLVIRDIESNKLAYGVPAKVIRHRMPEDKYF